MTSATASKRPRSWRARLASWLPLIALLVAAIALFVAWRVDQRPSIVVSDEVAPGDATALLERANDAVNFADTILSFLEGASVLLGAVIALGAWMLRNSVQDQIAAIRSENIALKEELTTRQNAVENKVNSSVTTFEQRITDRETALNRLLAERNASVEQRLAEREDVLNSLQTEVRAQLDQALADTREQILEARTRADRSFRLLNNLVLAEQQVRAHNHASALNILEDAAKDEPDNYAVNYLLGYLYSLRKEFDLAIRHLEKSLEQEVGFAPAIAALGLALRRKGDSLQGEDARAERNAFWSEAEMRLLSALKFDPYLTDAEGESYYGSLGGLYRRQGRYADAIGAYQQAARVTPTSSYPLINLASLSWHEGWFDAARAYFRRVHDAARLKLDMNPLDNWARADYAQALVALGEREEALRQIQLVRDNHPEPGLLATIRDGLAFMAEAPTRIEGMDELLAAIDQALADQPPPTA